MGWREGWWIVAAASCLVADAAPLVCDVTAYGAKGDGKTDDTAAFRRAVSHCSAGASVRSPATVLVPKGRYRTSSLTLASYLTLHLSEGSVLEALPPSEAEPERYPVVQGLPGYVGSSELGDPAPQSFLYAEGTAHTYVIGPGLINGTHAAPCQALVRFVNCTDLELSGFSIVNSPCWTVHPVLCNRVRIMGISIDNHYFVGTDGIDPDSCVDVLIEGNTISGGDDYVAVKSGTTPNTGLTCRDVVVRGNTFLQGLGLSIGSETAGGIENVLFENNVIKGPTFNGLYIKTAPCRGAFIRDVRYINNTISNASSAAIALETLFHNCTAPAGGPPRVTGITHVHASATNCGSPGHFICDPVRPCEGIDLRDVSVMPTGPGWNCSEARGRATDVHPPLTCL